MGNSPQALKDPFLSMIFCAEIKDNVMGYSLDHDQWRQILVGLSTVGSSADWLHV